MAVLKIKKITQLTGHNAAIFALTLGDTPQYFISGAGDGWIVRWNTEEPEIGKLIAKVDTQIFSLLNLSDYNIIIAGNMNGGLHWIHPENPEKTKNIAHHQKGVFDIIQVGEFVFTLGGEGKITRWSAPEERSLESLYVTNQSLRSIDFCAVRNEIAIGASDNNIYIMDVNTLEIKHIIHRTHGNSVFVVKYSPDGRYLLSGGRDAQLKAWNTENNFCQIFTQPAHWFTINHIAFHPDGQWFASASRDKTIKIWDASNFDLLKVIDVVRDKGHVNSVNRLLWIAPENYLISASDDRTMIVWKIE